MLGWALLVGLTGRAWGAPARTADRAAGALLTAGLGTAMVLAFGRLPLWYAPTLAILSAVAVIDRAHHILPNRWVLSLVGCALWSRFAHGGWIMSLLVAGGVFLFFLAVHVLSHGGLGMGDVKFSAALAFALGYPAAVTAMVVGLWASALYALMLLLVWRRRRTRTLPLGPFLALGGLVGLVELLH